MRWQLAAQRSAVLVFVMLCVTYSCCVCAPTGCQLFVCVSHVCFHAQPIQAEGRHVCIPLHGSATAFATCCSYCSWAVWACVYMLMLCRDQGCSCLLELVHQSLEACADVVWLVSLTLHGLVVAGFLVGCCCCRQAACWSLGQAWLAVQGLLQGL